LNALFFWIVFNTEQNYIFNTSGVAEWFGIPEGAEGMDKVLPMHKNFPPSSLYNKTVLFDDTPPPSASASASNKEPNVMQSSLFG
jgi:hypothetical protein